MTMKLPFPKIIHQTWKTDRVPSDWLPSQNSWKQLFPDWDYRLWTDKQNRQFIKTYYTKYLNLYDKWEYNIQRADMIRYFLLHRYGGAYCDLDNKPKINFEYYFCETNCDAYFVAQHISGVTNALMFSKPGADIWLEVFDEMVEASENEYYAMMPKHFHV
jgi:mannosyltransferase OCH1-like enzyme